LSPEKGCDLLVGAFNDLCSRREHDWRLVLVGNGSVAGADVNKRITLKAFASKVEIAREMAGSGAFCMPSHRAQWGVAIHEAAAAGLPLVLSDVCGAAPMFLIPGFNGELFKASSRDALTQAMERLIAYSDTDLLRMADNSHELARRISPAISAASVM